VITKDRNTELRGLGKSRRQCVDGLMAAGEEVLVKHQSHKILQLWTQRCLYNFCVSTDFYSHHQAIKSAKGKITSHLLILFIFTSFTKFTNITNNFIFYALHSLMVTVKSSRNMQPELQ
jgi:hypothetical protein